MEKRKLLFIKIVIPALIAVLIFILWIVKSNSYKDGNKSMSLGIQSITDLPEHLHNADFPLR